MDSPLYVRMAEDLLAGDRDRHRRTTATRHSWRSRRCPPGRELPGRAVSVLASLVVVALTWSIARRRVVTGSPGRRRALVALQPLLAVYGARS
jgi:hypothetical protein